MIKIIFDSADAMMKSRLQEERDLPLSKVSSRSPLVAGIIPTPRTKLSQYIILRMQLVQPDKFGEKTFLLILFASSAS